MKSKLLLSLFTVATLLTVAPSATLAHQANAVITADADVKTVEVVKKYLYGTTYPTRIYYDQNGYQGWIRAYWSDHYGSDTKYYYVTYIGEVYYVGY
ncbi:hypothetical protein [Tumebacillus lipolyticus]|uniref:SH3b domain-containing protein n=1 Tax=Tumebacillus lipolyticus TaxID=1280370 RepID=A0ABW4ZRE4_9BACL